MRWPKGPPHLALNPPYFLGSFFCFVFLFFFWRVCFDVFLIVCVFVFRQSSFPLKKMIFLLIFQCLHLFFLAFLTSPFHSLCLSLYLVIFLLSSFLVFFVFPSLSFGFLFVGLFLCFRFMQRTT